MKTLLRLMIAFLAVTGAVLFATVGFGVEFAHEEFWAHHGVFFLVSIMLFPRLTLIFGGVATGGLLWWLGLLFAPRLLVAVLATLTYWNQNPVLVAAAWVVALGGESSEKFAMVRRTRAPRAGPQVEGAGGYDNAKWVDSEPKK